MVSPGEIAARGTAASEAALLKHRQLESMRRQSTQAGHQVGCGRSASGTNSYTTPAPPVPSVPSRCTPHTCPPRVHQYTQLGEAAVGGPRSEEVPFGGHGVTANSIELGKHLLFFLFFLHIGTPISSSVHASTAICRLLQQLLYILKLPCSRFMCSRFMCIVPAARAAAGRDLEPRAAAMSPLWKATKQCQCLSDQT